MRAVKPTRSLYSPLAEINVTPFVDVMLVLLIVFMITAPMLAAGMRVNLPPAKSAQPVDPKEPIIITVQKDGKSFLGRDEISPGGIVPALRTRLGDERDRAIHLRGDREANYGAVIAVMDQLAAAGFAKIALIANARGAEHPAQAGPSRQAN